MDTQTGERLSVEEIEARWEEIATAPELKDLPGIVETDVHGQIVRDQPLGWHRRMQQVIARRLEEERPDGLSMPELAVHTAEGTKVPDVVWCSPEVWEQHRDARGARVAPEICVEVISTTNTQAEMAHKRRLYFDGGAEEVWLCDEEGSLRFFDANGEIDHSRLVPGFPASIA